MTANGRRWKHLPAIAAVAAACFCMGLLATRPPSAPPLPDVAAVQAAYDAEKASGSPLHVDDLLIEKSDCALMTDQRYGCQVSYVRKSNVGGRLYFDVISIESQRRGWKLLSGLCRGKKDVSL